MTSSVFTTAFPAPSEVMSFQQSVVKWFQDEGADYPWRRTSDPYAILVSEMMLQQTRIATVLERKYFERWMRDFPTTGALANAPEEKVLKAWEGLGYYNRARNLQKAARVVESEHAGKFPETLERILRLPGIGRYTAGAVASFAFERKAPIVDGNILRVLSRILLVEEPIDVPAVQRKFWEWAEALTPEKEVKEYNSGLMELGQRICRKSSPDCQLCPVQSHCQAYKKGKANLLPVKKGKVKLTARTECVAILLHGDSILLEQETGSRRNGLWRLPEVSLADAEDWEELFRFDYFITRYRVDLRIFIPAPSSEAALHKRKEADWFPLESEDSWPAVGSPYRKAIRKFLEIRDDLIMKG